MDTNQNSLERAHQELFKAPKLDDEFSEPPEIHNEAKTFGQSGTDMQALEQEEQRLLQELEKVDEVVSKMKNDYASIRINQIHK